MLMPRYVTYVRPKTLLSVNAAFLTLSALEGNFLLNTLQFLNHSLKVAKNQINRFFAAHLIFCLTFHISCKKKNQNKKVTSLSKKQSPGLKTLLLRSRFTHLRRSFPRLQDAFARKKTPD